jgi:HTH-type transcriptional regulator/antitoxin HigA
MIVTPSVIIVKRGAGSIKTVRTYANLASLAPLFPHSGYGTIENTMKIAPIKMKRDYDRALRRIEQLMDAKPGTKNGDELDVLTTLVEAYEAKHHVIYPPNPVEAIKFRMDQLGMTRKDLEAMLGGRGRVSEILTKKRGLSLEMIRRLHRELQIPLESLVGTAA